VGLGPRIYTDSDVLFIFSNYDFTKSAAAEEDRLITLLILKNQCQIVGKSGNAISVIRYLIVGIY
jgi:hypothetical protein